MAKKLEYTTDYLFNYNVIDSVNDVIDEASVLKDSVNELVDNTLSFQQSSLSAAMQDVVSVSRIAWGIDSLTEGTPDSPAKYAGEFLGATSQQSAELKKLESWSVSDATSGIKFIENQTSRGDFPKTHSLCGFGIYTESGADELFRLFYNIGNGVGGEFHTARVFYLQQPSGGTFDVRHYAQDGSSGPITSVDTSGAIGLQHIDISRDVVASQPFIECSAINGDVAILGVLFLTSSDSVADHKFSLILAQGGASVEDFSKLNATTQTQWFSALGIQSYIFNGGTNDRFSRTGAQVASDAESFLDAIESAGVNIGVVIPTQTADYASTNSPFIVEAIKALALSKKWGMLDVPELIGDYTTVAATYGMNVDDVHPSSETAKVIASIIKNSMSLTSVNGERWVYGYTGGSSSPYVIDASAWDSNNALMTGVVETELYRFTIPAPYIYGYLEFDVTCRAASGVEYWVTRKFTVNFNTNGTGDVYNNVITSNDITSSFRSGGWSVIDFTVSYTTSGADGVISITPNLDANVFAKLSGYKILLTSYLTNSSVILKQKAA